MAGITLPENCMSRSEATNHAALKSNRAEKTSRAANSSAPAVRLPRGMRRRAARHRQGIILLIVLVLLALFTMLLISFVVATVTNRQSVIISARTEQTGDPPASLLHGAFMQVVRGPRDSNSVMGPHSLLEDMYGNNTAWAAINSQGTRGKISSYIGTKPYLQDQSNPSKDTPLFQFSSTLTDFPHPNNTFSDLRDLPYGYYNGLVITMIDGPAAGRSSRIVNSYYDPPNPWGKDTKQTYFQMLSFDGTVPNVGDSFLINGRPFSGTGFGYRPSAFQAGQSSLTRLLDAIDPTTPGYNPANPVTNPTLGMFQNGTGLQYALLPNPRRGVFTPNRGGQPPLWYLDPAGPGGANEDYDAPDFQNMLLAMRIWANPTGNGYQLWTPLPSLHRPDLLYYWNQRWKNQPLSQATPLPQDLVTDIGSTDPKVYFPAQTLLRKVVLRPLQMDHPNFTGSNPNFNLVNGPWDVDNDGDGTPDSIWVDLGFPAQTTPDGRRYKPLFAIMCLDMDGKLNLNAHSTWRHTPSTSVPGLSRFNQVISPFAQVNTSTPQGYFLKVGSGYGPPEISLHPLFEPGLDANGKVFKATGELANLLGGILSSPTSRPIEGRYGEIGIAQTLQGATYNTNPGAGITLSNEPFNWLRELDYPLLNNLGNFPHHQNLHLPTTTSFGTFNINNGAFNGAVWTQRTNFGNPPDLDGDGMLGLDLRGQPLYIDYPGVFGANTGQSGLAGDAGWGEKNEAVDDPYELDLSLNAKNDGYAGVAAFANFGSNEMAINGQTTNVVSVDAPFDPAELERILRWNDADATTLPDRIIRLAPQAFTYTDTTNPQVTLVTAPPPPPAIPPPPTTYHTRFPYYPELAQLRNLITTHSFDLPVPSMVFTAPEQLTELQNSKFGAGGPPPIANGHLSQLVAARIYRDTLAAGQSINYSLNVAVSQLLSPDLITGEKMDINRPFGNGYDDNQNNVIDDAGEYEQGWAAMHNNVPVPFDSNNDGASAGNSPGNGWINDVNGDGVADWRDAGDINGDGNTDAKDAWATPAPRQLLARHLYVLMMLLKDDNFRVYADLDGDGVPNAAGQPGTDKDVAYYFAQWAVNVVDFRDRDAIMTPFEFDIYPFIDNNTNVPGTWDVDGVLSSVNIGSTFTSVDDAGTTYRGLVWGAEKPELLITETSATHDRRTRDTNKDSSSKKYTMDPMNPDPNYDQVRRPQGTLLVELYNPNPPMTVANEMGGEAPNELYSAAGSDAAGAPAFGVDLAKRAPARTGESVGAPVWRLAVMNQQAYASLKMPQRQPVLPYNFNTSSAFNPNVSPIYPASGQVPAGVPVVDRVAYFTSQPAVDSTTGKFQNGPTLDVEPWRQFYPQQVNSVAPEQYAIVPPNRYAVVGAAAPTSDPYLPNGSPSGIGTSLGNRDLAQDSPTNDSTYPLTSVLDRYYRRIIFTPNVSVYSDILGKYVDAYGPPIASSTYQVVKPAIGIPMAPLLFSTGSGAPMLVNSYNANNINYANANRSTRFSLTEPTAGYPYSSSANATVKAAGGGTVASSDENAYYDPDTWTISGATGFPDLPYDQDTKYFLPNTNATLPNTYDQQRPSFAPNGNTADATTAANAPPTVIYLQRLANPLLPWDANANPYIIVDQMPVDLTMYNSEKGPPAPSSGSASASNEFGGTTPKFNFDSRWRSPNPVNALTTPGSYDYSFNNLWYPFGYLRPGSGPSIKNNNFMATATWGYLNFGYGYGNATTSGVLAQMWNGTSNTPSPPLQVNGEPSGTILSNQQADYRGDPTLPFPWLNWNNRPFVSSKELMLVPLGSPASMLAEMTVGVPQTWPGSVPVPTAQAPSIDPNSAVPTAAIGSPYEPTNTSTQQPLPKGEFGHLPNVFHSPHYTGFGTARSQPAANFYRMLDYVHVPSRFTGTETWLPFDVMQGNSNLKDLNFPLPLHLFHPPFNRISRWRDPGRVNINTIFDPFVWQGIVDEGQAAQVNTPPWRNLWGLVCNSRLGTGNAALDSTNAYLQTNVQNLLGTNPVMPSITSAPFRSSSGHTLVPLNSMRAPSASWQEREVDATILRATASVNSYPLFEYAGVTGGVTWPENGYQQDTITGLSTLPAHENPNRNPYFAYKAYRRLDNLLTTRSNVYAVWITVGYFEVSPAPSNDPQRAVKYPDGWVLGQELGADTGEIERHRAFYMYDRTIPVGFERGENHNVHRGILLERFIE